MKVEILREAESELTQAIARYEEIESGLGVRFKQEFRVLFSGSRQTRKSPDFGPRVAGE